MSRLTLPRSPPRTMAIAFYVLLVVTRAQWAPTEAANILAVQSFSGKSHWNMMSGVLRALTDRGHNVTVFTPFVDGDRKNYAEVDMSRELKPLISVNIKLIYNVVRNPAVFLSNLINRTRSDCNAIYGHPRMTDILTAASPSDFDAVVTTVMGTECTAYVATVLRVPVIYLVPMPIITFLERTLFGHVPNPATVPHLYSGHGVPKTFADRFVNTALTVYYSCVSWYVERKLALSDPRPYDRIDLVKPSITFTNTHFITEPSRPLPPDVVQIGGIHLVPPKEIPKDVLEFIEDSPYGVIYFSFGSIVSMASLPENLQTAFRETFRKIPQRVLWKYEGEMKDKPRNVMTKKWFPQRDILLHPNVILFINHGGISGVYETVDAGVPVLGFPMFNDQSRNIRVLADAGMAISADLFSVTNDTFLNAVSELVNNESYRNSARVASELFKDRPASPAESVVYWTEYVLRHKGAPHLKSRAIDLPWYQYFLVDVVGTLWLIMLVVAGIAFYGLRIINAYTFARFRGRKPKTE
ncbi:UDP-glucuronosyl/UDP-glucosyltransferase [Cinara cedri]|uniref:UDP-glucuronosyl/UDP-glucosyltransferase n=1 Tax=Cinara cedri TaxID=506608 RepID=A0A5E4MQ06_9HEMI|nr:UDP-glucuronosyl/UDP-glucosyltransferase [Cinara cedri]